MPTYGPLSQDFQVLSDAAGSLGYGAIFKSHWFSGAWSAVQSLLSITYKELLPIVVAVVGCGVGSVCPITALGSYLSLHGSAPGPLFMVSDGHPLTWQQLSSSVQSTLNGAGYSGSYSGHNFRIGATTTAAA